MSGLYVKVCGITHEHDIDAALSAGANAVGLNLWPKSPRSVTLERAAALAERVRGEVEIVTVTVDASDDELAEIERTLRPDRMQLHAQYELACEQIARWPQAYVAVGLRTDADVEQALRAPGRWILVDAKDEEKRGGTGLAPPAPLAARVCAARPTVLAGGLTPHNVAAAVASIQPAGVDVASGVELSPGKKDPRAMAQFVEAARAAAGEQHV